MNMLQGLYTGANAVDTYKNSLITTAHNIANINTPYYKSNSLQLQDLKYGGINVSSIRQNEQLSYTIQSGRTLDFVIDGRGEFKLDAGGDEYFTRRGVFQVDAEGDLVDSRGRVLLADVLEEGETPSQISVAENGVVSVNNQERGKIDLYSRETGQKIADKEFRLKTGMLEASNVDIAREIVDMLTTQRAMSFNYANIRTNSEMLGLIINLRG